jgi:hypothetical protein
MAESAIRDPRLTSKYMAYVTPGSAEYYCERGHETRFEAYEHAVQVAIERRKVRTVAAVGGGH